MSFNNTDSFEPSYDTCKAVSDQCPVSATLYGDYFTGPACIFFALAFATFLIIQIFHLFKSRAWSYGIYLGVGTGFELLGYYCRYQLSDNPWQFMPFVLQLFLLMLAPTFVAAAISVTFKHLVIYYGSQWSPMKPVLYPWVFVGSDVASIVIQAAGCVFTAMATSGDKPDPTKSDIGSVLLILGVSFQVVNMAVCGGLMLWYYRRRSKDIQSQNYGDYNHVYSGYPSTNKTVFGYDRVQIFVWSISAAFVAIIIRCIYRIPEMASGWGSDLMKDEVAFLICDGAMILLAVALVSIVHPAVFFPQISETGRQREKDEMEIPLRGSVG